MTPLRAQRERHQWSKVRLDMELRRAAKARGETLPQAESLGRQVARWENGHGTPGDLYQQLFCDVYGCSPAELGFAEVEEPSRDDEAGDEFAVELARASSVDTEVVKLLQGQTDGIRLLDARQGAQLIRDQMRGHIAHIEELNRHAVRPGVRRMLAAVQADTSALAGWQALDVGTTRESWDHFERAKAAAREAGDPSLLAFATAEQAYLILDLGDAEQAAELVEYARHEASGTVPSLMGTWLHAAVAEMNAAAGNVDLTRTALDEATHLLPAEPDTALPFLALNETHLARWRGHCLARIGDAEAVDDLGAALAAMDGSYVRAEAGLRVDLATALTVRGEHAAAEEHLRAARISVGRAGSLRQGRRIEKLTQHHRS